MKILIVPSITMESGSGLRLKCINGYLNKHGVDSRIYSKDNKKEEYDFVMVSKPLPMGHFPGIVIRSKYKILDFDDLEFDYHKGIKAKVIKGFVQSLPRYYDYITTHTDNLEDYLKDHLGIVDKKIIRLNQGIDCDLINTIRSARVSVCRKYNIDSSNRILFWAGHLGPASGGLSELIGFVADFMESEEGDFIFVIVGGGDRSKYEKIAKSRGISDKVMFLGQKSHEETIRIMKSSDVCLNYMEDNPANRNRSSIKIREYLMSGVPVVCNVVGDVVEFQEFIHVFNPSKKDSFRNELSMALGDSNVDGKKYISKHYDWNTIIKNFIKELEGVLSG